MAETDSSSSQPDDAETPSDSVQSPVLGPPAATDEDTSSASPPDDSPPSPPSPPEQEESKSMNNPPILALVDEIPNAPPSPPPPSPPASSASVNVSTSASSIQVVPKNVNVSTSAGSNQGDSNSSNQSKPPSTDSPPSNPSPFKPPSTSSLPAASSIIPHPSGSKSTNQPSPNVQSSPPTPDSGGSAKSSHGKESRVGAIAGASAASVLIVLFLGIFLLVRWRKKKKLRNAKSSSNNCISPPPNVVVKSDGDSQGRNNAMSPCSRSRSLNSLGSRKGTSDSGIISAGKTSFSYEELTEITHGFSRENVLGEGGFGCVYKGWLQDGRVVAVKQLKAGSGQGDREFKAEVEIISRVHHRHLVSLVGYCISENQRLLIYEYVPNKTLEHHLHGKGLPVLEWSKRMKIAIGSAKGLAYLHEDCHPKIIHRDIKSANILLDDAFEAQVADFGLAKLYDGTQSHVSTRVMGTFGYLAPEYALSGKLTDRSDVFSFGVVLLELITGRKPVDPSRPLGDESLVEWARPLLIQALETRNCSELVDPLLETQYVEDEMFVMIEVAAACVRHSAAKRPRMVKVVRALDNEGEHSDLSNGMKYGQSFAYNSGQYSQEISIFRRLQLGDDTSSEFDSISEFSSTSREHSKPRGSSREFSSSDIEPRARSSPRGEHRHGNSFSPRRLN